MKLSLLPCLALMLASATASPLAETRKQRDDLTGRALWRESLELYREQLLPASDEHSGDDLEKALRSLAELGEWEPWDDEIETALATHPNNPHLLRAAAIAYREAPHHGSLVAGEFRRSQHPRFAFRGPHPSAGGGAAPSMNAMVDCQHRDRVRSLQLLLQALPLAPGESFQADLWKEIRESLQPDDDWKWQVFTPLDRLPAWDDPGPQGGTEGVPWRGEGPVLYNIPASWEQAANDGERARFAMAEEVRLNPAAETEIILTRAAMSQEWFGPETLHGWGGFGSGDDEATQEILTLESLEADECLARTSIGIRRFRLPAEHHYLALYRSIASKNAEAADALVRALLDRRQFSSAREALEDAIRHHGPGEDNQRRKLLRQITGNWGRFGETETTAAGRKPQVPLIFRNAREIQLSAQPVDVAALLEDTRNYLKANPRELDWQRLHPSQVPSRLLTAGGARYLGKSTAEWTAPLTPREGHRDAETSLEIPLETSGAWWITGRMKNGGDPFHTLVWIVDTVILRRHLDGATQWWLSRATDGAPLADVPVEFFGYNRQHLAQPRADGGHFQIQTAEATRTTDADGRILIRPGELPDHHEWLAIARPPGGGSPAFFGFLHSSFGQADAGPRSRDVSHGISDRPIYKPGDTAHFRFSLRNVSHFEADDTRWGGQTAILRILDGRGSAALTLENLRTDETGNLETQVVLPKDAALGRWTAMLEIPEKISAASSFRVEEFRKPEFEVRIEAPQDPVRLGETIRASLQADYFHGSPVANASVELTITRESVSNRIFPTWRWDWLYGRGTWWNGLDASWHPTWKQWGCLPPPPPWWQGERWTPEEIVRKETLTLGPDGRLEIEIDTQNALATHGDLDARFHIEARVTDASRREENGTGEVLATRKPFEVFVWTQPGHARPGEEIEATLSAIGANGKPLPDAAGDLILWKLERDAKGTITEREIARWPVRSDAEGLVRQRFAAPNEPGHCRLSAVLRHKDSEPVEGGCLLPVHGPGRANPAEWTFGALELIADRESYQPGDTLRLRVNSDHSDAHVWLFLRVTGTAGREARRIQLDGKSLECEIPLTAEDMPNTFLEAVTVHGARVHTAVKPILLPPASKLVQVELEPAKPRVKPREKSSLQVRLRDADGKPLQGRVILAIYDKALDALAGGSNVLPLHEAFWNWKNHYAPPHGLHSLPESHGSLCKGKAMETLGSFGEVFAMDGAMPMAMTGGAASGRMMLKAAPMAMADMAVAESAGIPAGNAAPADDNAAPITVRSDFSDLLKWAGSIETDAAGNAEIPLEFPDNLTTWKARVWHIGPGTRVGEGSAEIITSKDLMIRLQTPRFLIERDQAVVSTILHNHLGETRRVRVSLETDPALLRLENLNAREIEIPAKGEARIDWPLTALASGQATLRAIARAGDDGDALELPLPIYVHGMLRQDAWSRTLAPEDTRASLEIEVPAERAPEQSRLTLRFSPSVAAAVVDAIPYLATAPHNHSEQTVNRFVPAIIAREMLRSMQVNLAEVRSARTNLNPQELGNRQDRAEQWRIWQDNPVFHETELDRIIAAGITRLTETQNRDGGWGWFSGYGEDSWPHTTALVVHGLLRAREHGTTLPESLLERGLDWLTAYENGQTEALQRHTENEALRREGRKPKHHNRPVKAHSDSLDAFTRMVLGQAGRDSEPMLAFLHRDRLTLTPYALCLTGLEHHRRSDAARRDELLRMLDQFLQTDPENQTSRLEWDRGNHWWLWHGSEIETNAWYLQLLSRVRPDRPETRGLVKYLVNNRKHANYWESSRDTAFCVEAIAHWFRASGEGAPDMEVELRMNGKALHQTRITRENLFSFPGTVTLQGADVPTGRHQIEWIKSGKGPLYANTYLEVFSLEDRLRPAGLEIKVSRQVSRIVEDEAPRTAVPDQSGLPVEQRVRPTRRQPLADGAALQPGDRIEVELVVESKNDYEYLLLRDPKPAGFEAIDALSGHLPGGIAAYREPRDASVDFFLRVLPQGRQVIRYQLRAESPGTYKALPATATGLYAPELRGNSADTLLRIHETSLPDPSPQPPAP